MDKNYFPTWNLNSLSSSAQEQPMDCFMNSNWDQKSTDEYNHFGSSLTSMVSSQAAGNDSFAFREFNAKLGTINNSHNITPPFSTMNMNPGSCFATEPRNSQNLPEIAGDPGFAERAAKFSSFGNRSFNGRTSELGHSNGELSYRSNAPSGKLPRTESSPALKQGGSSVENMNSGQTQMDYRPNYNGLVSVFDKNLSKLSGSGANSNEESSVSEQVLSGETGSKAAPGELNSRKRKAISRGKAKNDASNQAAEAPKVGEADDNANAKRSKPSEGTGSEDNGAGDENQKPAEPFKDYIHVRARRGQATDSHSLAERVRREKISERMKLLQDLVPGCNKVTGKALMLDEIINYVQALQRQVEFLSMKLATVNPRMEGDIDSLVSKDPNASLPQPMYALDSSAAMIYGQQRQQTLQPNGSVSQCQMDPFDTSLCRNLGLQLPSLNGFNESLHQFAGLCEDDLQSIVQMGLIQNPNGDVPYHSQGFSGKDK